MPDPLYAAAVLCFEAESSLMIDREDCMILIRSRRSPSWYTLSLPVQPGISILLS